MKVTIGRRQATKPVRPVPPTARRVPGVTSKPVTLVSSLVWSVVVHSCLLLLMLGGARLFSHPQPTRLAEETIYLAGDSPVSPDNMLGEGGGTSGLQQGKDPGGGGKSAEVASGPEGGTAQVPPPPEKPALGPAKSPVEQAIVVPPPKPVAVTSPPKPVAHKVVAPPVSKTVEKPVPPAPEPKVADKEPPLPPKLPADAMTLAQKQKERAQERDRDIKPKPTPPPLVPKVKAQDVKPAPPVPPAPPVIATQAEARKKTEKLRAEQEEREEQREAQQEAQRKKAQALADAKAEQEARQGIEKIRAQQTLADFRARTGKSGSSSEASSGRGPGTGAGSGTGSGTGGGSGGGAGSGSGAGSGPGSGAGGGTGVAGRGPGSGTTGSGSGSGIAGGGRGTGTSGAGGVGTGGLSGIRLRNYQGELQAKITNAWNIPPQSGGLQAAIHIVVIRSGGVQQARLVKGSGNALFDESLQRAIRQAQPLPSLPHDYGEASLQVTLNFKGRG